MPRRILILGGTADARRLAGRLTARADLSVILSLAGRTENPVAQPVPVRMGGFGGVEGLETYLKTERIAAVVDATHPYAAQMSRHAAAACARAGVPLLALGRAPWEQRSGDKWREAADVAGAVALLGDKPRSVFLALGRNEVHAFEAAPWHAYLVRSVDPVTPPLAVPDATYVVARGPFTAEGDRALMEAHRIAVVVAKNSGGPATYGKIEAARALGLEVILLARPQVPQVPAVETADGVLDWLEGLFPL
ncbi:cobalt-precorrin-6A reductase [Xanthobacteraceae bacterium A53D]